jgi:hypothetical protein
MQLLPESSISLINMLSSFVPNSVIPTSVDDIEIQVGVPKF